MKIVKSGFANGYLNIIDKKYTGFNKIKKFISDLKFRHTCKKIFNRSPSFGQLWSFAEFVRISERVYFYNNKNGSTLYSSSSYKTGENGFIITSDIDKVIITAKLYSDNQGIILDIKRMNGTNLTTTLRFRENNWDGEHEEESVILLDNVIGIINRHIVMLLKYCYERQGSYDYERTIPKTNKKF